MTDQATGDSAHPYRVLVPVVSLEAVCDVLEMPPDKRNLLRSRDKLHPYLYLPVSTPKRSRSSSTTRTDG